MDIIDQLKEKVLSGELIDKKEALQLVDAPLEKLNKAADEIRAKFCKDNFDLCTIINAKSGLCSEDCKFCAQSSFYKDKTNVKTYNLLSGDDILKEAIKNYNQGALRFSIVTSGKRLNSKEIEEISKTIKRIKKETKLEVCISLGLLDYEDFKKLKDSGASRVHCNLETSERNFKNICSTHSFQDKINTIKSATKAGLSLCSGGIVGLGETMEDRIDMCISSRNLGAVSIPINMLNPIPGTPFEKNKILTEEEMSRIVSIFRFIMPKAAIRLAGGRGLVKDKGLKSFKSGANSAISGDMLTTHGINLKTDYELLENIGYKAHLI